MRRWSLALAVMVGLLGGCAEAGREPPGSADGAGVRRIEAFIAAQREADSRVCAEQGHRVDTVGHRWCVRRLAAQRRAEIEGVVREQQQREREAGWCRDESAGTTIRCLDI